MRIFATSLLLAITSGSSFAAESWKCEHGDKVRRVEVQYEKAGQPVPCKVLYFKDTENPGVEEVPYQAANKAGFCEEKAQELVEKLKGWSWDCSGADEAKSMPEAAKVPTPSVAP